ncbi:MAG: hypothetical protein V3V00_13555 [Saprospiraceae bacterium]
MVITNFVWVILIVFSNQGFFGAKYEALKNTLNIQSGTKKEYKPIIINKTIEPLSLIENDEIITSALPLSASIYSLKGLDFKIGGGSISTYGGKILLLDRMGTLSIISEKKISQIELNVPNDIDEYLRFYALGVSISTLRIQSFVYDSLRSQLIVCFTKFEGLGKNSLKVATIDFDIESNKVGDKWREIFSYYQ